MMASSTTADQSYGTVQRQEEKEHLQPRWSPMLSSFGVGFGGSGTSGAYNLPRRRHHQHVRAVCWRRLRMIMPRHRTLRSIRHVLVILCIPLLLLLLLSVYLIDSNLGGGGGRRKSQLTEERMANDGQDSK